MSLVALHVQEDLRGLMEDLLNTLIHSDRRHCARKLADVMNCDHSTIVQNLQGSKIGCMGTAFSKPKPQKSEGAICASLLTRHRLARE